jgi:hypothetical protein
VVKFKKTALLAIAQKIKHSVILLASKNQKLIFEFILSKLKRGSVEK